MVSMGEKKTKNKQKEKPAVFGKKKKWENKLYLHYCFLQLESCFPDCLREVTELWVLSSSKESPLAHMGVTSLGVGSCVAK